jgi:chromosome segregation ATPase
VPVDRHVALSAHLGHDAGPIVSRSLAAPAHPHARPLAQQLTRSADGMRDAVRSVERARLDVRHEEAAVRELHDAIRDRQAQAREYHALTADLLRALEEARSERHDASELLRAAEEAVSHAHARAARVEAKLDGLSAERQAALDATHAAQLRAADLRELENEHSASFVRARAEAQQARAELDAVDDEARHLLHRLGAEQRAAEAEEEEAARAITRAATHAEARARAREELGLLNQRCEAAQRAKLAADESSARDEAEVCRIRTEASALARELRERAARPTGDDPVRSQRHSSHSSSPGSSSRLPGRGLMQSFSTPSG